MEFWYTARRKEIPYGYESSTSREYFGLNAPRVIGRLSGDDYENIIYAENGDEYFVNYDYIVNRIKPLWDNDVRLLALILNPKREVSALSVPKNYSFCGYDIYDGWVTLLTNYDSPKIKSDPRKKLLNHYYLLDNYEDAVYLINNIFCDIEDHYTEDIWAIWRIDISIHLDKPGV